MLNKSGKAYGPAVNELRNIVCAQKNKCAENRFMQHLGQNSHQIYIKYKYTFVRVGCGEKSITHSDGTGLVNAG